MPDQKRHEDQQHEQRTPGRDQDRGQQNFGNTQREPAQGTRSDQDRMNRDRQNQGRGSQSGHDKDDQSHR